MTVIDASVWVSRLVRRDVNHVVSLQWTQQWVADGHRLVAPTLFLAEVAGAVSRVTGVARFGLQATVNLLANVAFDFEVVDQRLAEAAARLAAELPLRGADAVYVALAERLGVPLITWDSEQLARAARVIDVRPPAV